MQRKGEKRISTFLVYNRSMDEKQIKDKDVKILAIVGMSGSGKSVVVDHLTNLGLPKIYFGGMIYKEMEKRGIERTADGESENLIAAGQKRIVLDGLYTWTEYKILKKEFPGQMTVLAVVVDKSIRHKRVAKRPERPFNAEEIQERDRSEIENLEKGGPIAMADYYLLNNGSVEELEKDVDEVLKKIDF